MSNDLADDLIGSTVVSFGSALLWDQAIGTGLLELFTELEIAAATECELLSRGLGTEFTFAFEQHSETAREFILLRDGQCAEIADEGMFFEVKDRHDRSSLTRCKKPAITGGRRILETANLRLDKYGGRNASLKRPGNIAKANRHCRVHATAIFN